MGYNAIGNFTFDTLTGDPKYVQQRPELYQRPGVSGTGIFWGGIKGEPFVLTSGVGLASQAVGKLRSEQYTFLVGYFAYVEQFDLSLSNGGEFVVLNVETIASHALAACVGGELGGTATWWLAARWVLIHIL